MYSQDKREGDATRDTDEGTMRMPLFNVHQGIAGQCPSTTSHVDIKNGTTLTLKPTSVC